MMFKGRVAIIITILAISGIFIAERLSNVGKKDYKAYDQLQEIANPPPPSEDYISKHKRSNSVKEYWYIKNNRRLSMQLACKESELVFTNRSDSAQVVENMTDIECVIQEELYYLMNDGQEVIQNEAGKFVIKEPKDPKDKNKIVDVSLEDLKPMQKVRFLKSKEGSFYYNTKTFSSNNAEFALMTAPGHNLENAKEHSDYIMSGIATTVNFFLGGKDLNFQAKHIKAKLYSQEGVS